MALSRRTLGGLAGTAVLGLALGGSVGGSSGAVTGSGASSTVPTGEPPAPPAADGRRHDVRFDRDALLVDGRRLVLWTGEMHYFRLPSPSLWRDVLEKMRAHGYNAVSVPVPWNHHSPAPGRHDFTGVRDLDLLLRTAAECRLYVILRPGPYLGADLDAGGLPGWLTAAPGRARTTDPGHLRHAEAWLAGVDAIAVRHLYSRGRGTVLLYQLEDAPDTAGADAYTARLRARVRADGIDVPLVDGYERPAAQAHGAAGVRRLGLARLAEGAAVPGAFLAFGGTSWGWQAAPGAPASYDRGVALDAGRQPTDEIVPVHQIGHLLRHVPDLARLERAGAVRAGDERLAVTPLVNPDTGTRVYVVRNDSGEEVTAALPDTGIDTPVTVPARDARLLVTGLSLGGRRKLAYATAQPMVFLSTGQQDIAVFTGRRGEMAHVVLETSGTPDPYRLDPEAAWAYDDRGRLHVTAPLGAGGLTRVRVRGGGADRPLLLLFADDDTSLRLWPYRTPTGSLLVQGPALLRSATPDGGTVRLTGDMTEANGLEVWGPRGVTSVTWNGTPVPTRTSPSGSLAARRSLPGVPQVVLPALGGWRRRTENPESRPGFDDADWPAATRKTSHSTTPVPEAQPVLFADDYGFPYGDVWYRGRLTGAAGLTSVALAYRTGSGGLLMAWLDGEPLGTHRMPAPEANPAGKDTWAATARFRLPASLRDRLRRPGHRPVLSVLVRRTSHAQDPAARGTHKAARGLTGAYFRGASPEVRWRLRGATAPDPVRGPFNNGGLYGERHGWHLPGHDDGDWEDTGFPRGDRRQGVTWYRTAFRLSVPRDVDASVGLVLDDDPDRAYRVQVFLNGWNMGEYLNDTGPRRPLALPNGVLRTRGTNTLALAVLADGTTPAGPGEVRLTLLGAAAGGVPVTPVESGG